MLVHQKRLDLGSIGVAWIPIFWWERLLIFFNRLFIVDISTIFRRIWKGRKKWSCKKVTQSTKYFVERNFPPSNPFNFRIQLVVWRVDFIITTCRPPVAYLTVWWCHGMVRDLLWIKILTLFLSLWESTPGTWPRLQMNHKSKICTR